jgi:bacteriocin biosynthesis cyclodehydratase domain-containing protein
MAAAVHMNKEHMSAVVVPVGAFGVKVSELLATDAGLGSVVSRPSLPDAFALRADMVLVVMWRPCPSLCDRADLLSYSSGRPWLPVTMEDDAIHVGPVVFPPEGPCYQCYVRRRAQHDTDPDAVASLAEAFDRAPSWGPAGYLPHMARLAAGVAKSLMHVALGNDSAGSAGIVVTIAHPGAVLARSTVVTCHDCGRCGTGPSRPAGGTSALLRVLDGTLR